MTQAEPPLSPTDLKPSNLARDHRSAAIQFLRFIALGAVAAAVNFGSRFLFSMVVPFELAVLCAYVAAAATGFTLFRLFVFPASSKSISEQSIAFLIVSIAGTVQTWVVSVLFLRLIFPAIHFSGPREACAHAIAICVPIVTSYFGHKRLTFR
jgi:putative flippase GtrA